MHTITLERETDFDGWRKAARALALNGVHPSDVTWRVRGHAPEPSAFLPEPPQGTFNVPAKFIELAKSRSCIAIPCVLPFSIACSGGCAAHHDLLSVETDPDMAQIIAMADAVHRDQHRMQASLRFREIGREQKSHYVAWFEPAHHIVEAQRRSSPAALPTCPGRS